MFAHVGFFVLLCNLDLYNLNHFDYDKHRKCESLWSEA